MWPLTVVYFLFHRSIPFEVRLRVDHCALLFCAFLDMMIKPGGIILYE
jgi:hypothetical protein